MANYVEYQVTSENNYKYVVNGNTKVFWLKNEYEVWSLDGRNKLGYLKHYKDNWYKIEGISYLAYVEK